MDMVGNLYGTNTAGAFELSPSGGGWTEQVVYSGSGLSLGLLTIDAAGNIFGAGVSQISTVFELSPNGGGGWTPIVLYHFTENSVPVSVPALDKAGNIYGTTVGGNRNRLGTVYKLSPGKNGKLTKETLYSVKRGYKGDNSIVLSGVVLDAAGNIYGTTSESDGYRDGTVFELVAPVGPGSYTAKVLWSFNGTEGANPSYGSLILGSAGNLYGTTWQGGEYNCGVVFEVTP
jgi:uncharacterized repeat protein (TIGR03803 family)